MPDSIRFLLILACLGGAAYGGIWWLSEYGPQPQEIVKKIPNDRFITK
jgi:hypothetical protein